MSEGWCFGQSFRWGGGAETLDINHSARSEDRRCNDDGNSMAW